MQNKKQAHNLIEDICKINDVVWGNPKGSYDDAQESAYPIEEALEGFELPRYIDISIGDYNNPKELSRVLVDYCSSSEDDPVTDVARFDKHLDAIYYAIGSLHKLGLDPSQIVEGLQVVHDANVMKGSKKDDHDKVIKPDQWEELFAPEPKLQSILDKRNF